MTSRTRSHHARLIRGSIDLPAATQPLLRLDPRAPEPVFDLSEIGRVAVQYVEAVHTVMLANRPLRHTVRDRRAQLRVRLIELVDALPRSVVREIDRGRA
jgi:hypothetical protein